MTDRVTLLKQIKTYFGKLDEQGLRDFIFLYYPSVSTNITTGMQRGQMERMLSDAAERGEGLEILVKQLQNESNEKNKDVTPMPTPRPSGGLSRDLGIKLRDVLLGCGRFDRSLFVDDRVNLWRGEVSFDGSLQNNINRLIALFLDKYHTGYQQYGLILLLQVMQDQVSSADGCYAEIEDIIQQLLTKHYNKKVSNPEPASPTPISSKDEISDDPPPIQLSDLYTRYERGLARLDKLLHEKEAHESMDTFYQLDDRLTTEIALARQGGDTPIRSAARAEIVSQLNRLAMSVLGKTFRELTLK